jgi:hypothetical protein
MKVCLICVEIFSLGKYGGFGRSARMIGRELAHRGVEVYAVVPMRGDQRPVERLDGITVLGFPFYNPWGAKKLYRECDADIYHSQEPRAVNRKQLRENLGVLDAPPLTAEELSRIEAIGVSS